MKTSIQILGVIAVATSLTYAEKGGERERKGPPNPQKMIEHLDKDGNGTVSLDEFKASKRGQENPEKAAEMFGRIDADSNGEITTDEFAKHMGKMRQRDHNPQKVLEHLDKDGNGTVSLEEFKAGKRAQEDPERAEKVFARIDANSDGQLSVEELAKHKPKPRGGKPGDGPRDEPGGANID